MCLGRNWIFFHFFRSLYDKVGLSNFVPYFLKVSIFETSLVISNITKFLSECMPRRKETINWNFCKFRILKFTIKGFWICSCIWKQLHRNIVEFGLGLFNRMNLLQWRWIAVLQLSGTVHKIWIIKIRFVTQVNVIYLC